MPITALRAQDGQPAPRKNPNVVAAQTALRSNQQTEITLHVQHFTATVQLVEALEGGGSAADHNLSCLRFACRGKHRATDESFEQRQLVCIARQRRRRFDGCTSGGGRSALVDYAVSEGSLSKMRSVRRRRSSA